MAEFTYDLQLELESKVRATSQPDHSIAAPLWELGGAR